MEIMVESSALKYFQLFSIMESKNKWIPIAMEFISVPNCTCQIGTKNMAQWIFKYQEWEVLPDNIPEHRVVRVAIPCHTEEQTNWELSDISWQMFA